MESAYKISEVYFEKDDLIVILSNQKYILKISEVSQKLDSSTTQERNNFNISPSGYGINWPLIVEDLSINGLLTFYKKDHVA